LSEQQLDAEEVSSDLDQLSYSLDEPDTEVEEDDDELAESSTAQDEDSESSPDEDEEDLSPDEIKALKSEKANQRFSAITQDAKDARAEAAATRAEIKALRERLDATSTAEVADFDEVAPTLEAHDYDQDAYDAESRAYEAAKAAHNVLKRNRQASQTATKAALDKSMFDAHTQKRMSLAAKVPELGNILSKSYLNSQTEGGGATAQAILRADNGGEIEYHIAMNPDLASRLNTMDQYQAIGEVARLAEQLKVKPKKRDPLPDPIGATRSGGGRTSEHKPKYSAGATYE
jgi:hypothetical protein